MSESRTALRERLETLFSIVFSIDDQLRIDDPSPKALEHMPWLGEQPLLTEVFRVERPRQAVGWDQLRERGDQLLLMTAADRSFAVRGQVVNDDAPGRSRLLFCGAPWLFWINSERPDLTLGIRDFAPQDAQLDQLFFMTTEKTMVEDLRLLNEQLQGAKTQLEAAQRGRDAFFAQMSHEMRTPLNGVVSALALLEHHALPEKSRELLGLANSSSRNLMNVINYVLDVSKIEAEDGNAELTPFELDALVESVMDIIEARALEKGLGLHARIEPGLPKIVRGDAARLRQTLLNLITNAIKFTHEGDVTVRMQEISNRPDWLRVDIIDTGIGIPGEYRERIFEPFFSVPREGQEAHQEGTGLGLDIVRRNIELMGGEISVGEGPGGGTAFTLRLPLEAVAEDLEHFGDTRSDYAESHAPLTGEVLLVDDNQTNLMLGGMLLERLGLNVRSAPSGEAAIESVASKRPDIILMDINMPGLDGFETTRRIHALPGCDSIPVLALTAYASSKERAKAKEVGMEGYLTKPVKSSELADALGAHLSRPLTPARDRPEQVQFDGEVLQALAREIGFENLMRVIETFRAEAREGWRALQAAENAESRAREAHTLVSTCRSFGLVAVADALADIEAEARAGRSVSPESLAGIGAQLDVAIDLLVDWTVRHVENAGA